MKIRNTYRTIAALGICAAALSGCKKSETPAADAGAVRTKFAFNAACPVQPDKGVSMRAPTVEYKGLTIGFCCEDCPKTWAEWPDSKKDEFVAAEKKALEVEGTPAEMPEMPETPDH